METKNDTLSLNQTRAISCSDSIILYANKLPPTWVDDNPTIASYCDPNDCKKISVSLDRISHNSEAIAGWLGIYSECINYTESMDFIIRSHTISNPEAIGISQASGRSYYQIDLETIKKKILCYDTRGFANHYEKYMSFKIEEGQLKMDLRKFRVGETCFSIPFFTSLVAKQSETNPTFEFAQVEIDNKLVLFFRIKDMQGNFSYYDLSQKPPKQNNIDIAL